MGGDGEGGWVRWDCQGVGRRFDGVKVNVSGGAGSEAEPGDTVTYMIFYRNMGNTPIKAVTIADSLLPRLEYLKGTARGPAGTAFSTAINRVGSTELRWTLPGILAPGATGHVSFDVIIR